MIKAIRVRTSSRARKWQNQNGTGTKGRRTASRHWSFSVVGLAVGATIFFSPWSFTEKSCGETQAQAANESYQGIQGHVYKLEPFLVNLSDKDQMRYLKARIDIESTDKKPNEEFTKRLPQLRDSIITVLSSKKFRDIYDSEGKKKLKEEIKEKLNQSLGQMRVRTIYFTEFVVQ